MYSLLSSPLLFLNLPLYTSTIVITSSNKLYVYIYYLYQAIRGRLLKSEPRRNGNIPVEASGFDPAR